MKDSNPIPVPQAVLDGIEAVRRSGLTNMLDRPRVAEIAEAMGFRATVLWISEHPELYAQGVFGSRSSIHLKPLKPAGSISATTREDTMTATASGSARRRG